MTPPLHIRCASEADIPKMHRLRMSVRENQLADLTLVQPHHYRTMIIENGRGWVAERNGGIVGFAIADLTRSSVWALFVDPASQRSGVGRRLHDTMVESGAEQVRLSTEPGTRAERFYLATQWQCSGQTLNGEAEFVLSRETWLGGRG